MKNDHPKTRLVAAVLLGVGLLVVFRMPGLFLPPRWLLGCLVLIPWLWVLERFHRADPVRCSSGRLATWSPLIVLAGVLIVMVFSSAALHKWFFFLSWVNDSRHVAGLPQRLAFFILITAFLTPLLLTPKRRIHWLVLAILLIFQATSFHELMKFTGGRALMRDDHPCMMFRLWEISRTWPQLLNYNPYWNAGVVDFVGTASGLNGLGAILRPILMSRPIHEVYTPVIGLAFIILVPWLTVLAVRVAGGRGVAPWAAGILGLGVSQHFFLWLLQYGTVGACFSTAFILPFAAGVFRTLWLGRREWWLVLLTVGSFYFLLMWPPGALMAATVLLAALMNARRWNYRRIGYLTLCGLLGLLLHYKTFGLLFFEGGGELANHDLVLRRPTITDVSVAQVLHSWGSIAQSGWKNLVSHLHEVNPVLVVLGFVGAMVFPRRSVRRWFVPILLALAILCGWGPIFYPNLELGRMSIPLAFVAIAPAALAIERILRTGHFRVAPIRAALVSLLILTGWNVRNIYAGFQKNFTVTHLGEQTEVLADFIRTKAVPGSRVLFAGPCVHGYGDGGHVAMLPYLSGHEMMACDYFHFSPTEVEYEYPPKPFRSKPDTLFEFLQNYNVNLVITRNKALCRENLDWAKMLAAEPARYREIARLDNGQVVVFRVKEDTSSLFLRGRGRVEATFNRIHVVTEYPNERTILKYNWHDGLRVDPPVQIRPCRLTSGLDLIEILWNGQTECTLRYISPW